MKNFKALSAFLLLCGCGPLSSNFVVACEDQIKQRLKSPSSYNRVDMRVTKAVPGGEGTPTHFSLFITYEASNSFGVMLRDQALCTYVSKDGSVVDAAVYNVELKM